MPEKLSYDEIPDLDYFEAGEHFVPFWDAKRKLAGLMVAAAVILPATTSAEENSAPQVEVQHSREAAMPASLPLPEAGSARSTSTYALPGTYEYVNEIFNRSPEDEMEAAREKSLQTAYRKARYNPIEMNRVMAGGAIDFDESMRNNYRVRRQLAEKYGLTMYNYLPTLAKFKELQQNKGDFNDYFNVTQDFLAKSGTTLRFPDPSREDESKYGAPSQVQRDMPEARWALKNIAESFMGLPKELTDLSSNNKGVEVVLVDIPAKKKVAGYTILDTDHNRIFIDIPSSGTDVVEHELGHDLDAALAGGGTAARVDQVFASLNSKPNVYNKKVAKNNANTFFDSLNGDYGRVWESQDASYATRCKNAKEVTEEQVAKAHDVEYISNYAGVKSILEDKAETFVPLIKSGPTIGGWRRVMKLPQINQKVRTLTERLAMYAPGLAGYLVESKYAAPEIGVNVQYYCDADYRERANQGSGK